MPPPGLQAALDHFDAGHRQPLNRALATGAVPLLAWAIVALLWTLPVPAMWFRPGAWGVLAIVLAFYWYWKRSHTLASALLLASAALGVISNLLLDVIGTQPLRLAGVAAGLVAAFALVLGTRLERSTPRWRLHPVHLLVAAAWVMARLLHRLGIRFSA